MAIEPHFGWSCYVLRGLVPPPFVRIPDLEF